MNIKDLIEFLGWLTAISFGIAILNFFVKYINKNYISKLGKEKAQTINLYKQLMKLIVKYHKLAGTIAVFSVLTHFFIAFSYGHISITGIIAAVLMVIIFILGIYGFFINKNYRGVWLKIHRALAFFLIIAILIHII